MLKFSIRDILWLTLVVALSASLYLHRRRAIAAEGLAESRLVQIARQDRALARQLDLVAMVQKAITEKVLSMEKRESMRRAREGNPQGTYYLGDPRAWPDP